MSYSMYKGTFKHCGESFHVYYDAYEGTFCFATTSMDSPIPSFCQHLYPARSVRDVYTFLEKAGIDSDITFRVHYLQ